MKKIYDKKRIQEAISLCKYKDLLERLPAELFLTEYEPGELISAPWLQDSVFQFVLSGELSVYFGAYLDQAERIALLSAVHE